MSGFTEEQRSNQNNFLKLATTTPLPPSKMSNQRLNITESSIVLRVTEALVGFEHWPLWESSMAKKGFSKEIITKLLVELRRFLFLKIQLKDYDAKFLSPSSLVDEGWHALMLFPRIYRDLCSELKEITKHAGDGLIDHNPLGGKDEHARRVRILRTLDEYENVYGFTPPSALWGDRPLSLSSSSSLSSSYSSSPSSSRAAVQQDDDVYDGKSKKEEKKKRVLEQQQEEEEEQESSSNKRNNSTTPFLFPSDTECITIRVKCGYGEMSLKVKRNIQFSKIFNAVAQKLGIGVGGLRFMLDGDHVKPTDTPIDFELCTGDQIDCIQETVGC